MRGSNLTGTFALLRFFLRLDRVRTPVWAVTVAFFFGYATVALNAVYPTQADRQVRAQLMSSPAAIMMTGPGYGLDNYSLGAMVANEMTLFLMIAVAIMNVQLIVRHTRAEEESGRSELVRAAVVGRHAPAVAAFGAAVVVNVAIIGLSFLALYASGQSVGGLPVADCLALACAVGVVGVVFAAVAVVTSQVTEHARAATGLGLAVVALAWFLGAVGNIQEPNGSWVAWLSPLGWSQQVRSFVDLRWWPLAISLVATVVLLVAGSMLAARRDFGAGLVQPRAGRAEAKARLRTPFALSLRLQRGFLWAWAIALALFAGACGTFVQSVSDMIADIKDNAFLSSLLVSESGAVGAFVAIMMLYLVLSVTSFAISSALRGRGEESSGRLEPILATAVSRSRWLGAQLAVTLGASVALLAVSGLGLGLGAFSTGQRDPAMWQYLVAALMYAPAVACIVGLAWVLYGWAPRWAAAVWAFVVFGFVVGLFGALLDLPGWLRGISPFYHVPQYPMAAFDAVPLVVEAVIAVMLCTVGFVGFRRRDVGR